MQLVLLSSITGQGIRSCLDNLAQASKGKALVARNTQRVLTVEDNLLAAANPRLKAYRKEPPGGFQYADVLLLPHSELTDVCHEAFDKSLALMKEQRTDQVVGLLAIHPVLYHQLTSEFVMPYQTGRLRPTLQKHDFELRFLVSVHDDVYDTHRQLLSPSKLFTPSITRKYRLDEQKNPYQAREPRRDVQEQLLLLDWRDRELSEAKSIAAGLAAKHFLFHQKGNRDDLWRIIGEGTKAVYFSHPISQPRRDLLGIADASKSKEPNPRRGHALQDACQLFAARLRRVAATIEPTAIDELRIHFQWLGCAEDGESGPTEADLSGHVLPPLTHRWPLSDGPHLGGAPPKDLHQTPLLGAPDGAFERLRPRKRRLIGLQSALKLLEGEILRQINVRDHTLAEQCDLVVAYRPFCLPDSPEPSGGVRKEIEAVSRKIALGRLVTKPAIFVVHPYADEKERRRKEFDLRWPSLMKTYFPHGVPADLATFRARANAIIVDAPYTITEEHQKALFQRLRDAIRELHLQGVRSGIGPPCRMHKAGRSGCSGYTERDCAVNL
jgi:hypothetical protein